MNGRVGASYQWSGDAVYTIGQAAESDMQLSFAVPKESTNIYFDGWAMLKSGINGDEEKKQAAESFVNFVSMPENAVRNMYYIGYTSAISGGDSSVIYDYAKWNYGYDSIVEETGEEQEEAEYSLGYFLRITHLRQQRMKQKDSFLHSIQQMILWEEVLLCSTLIQTGQLRLTRCGLM